MPAELCPRSACVSEGKAPRLLRVRLNPERDRASVASSTGCAAGAERPGMGSAETAISELRKGKQEVLERS